MRNSWSRSLKLTNIGIFSLFPWLVHADISAVSVANVTASNERHVEVQCQVIAEHEKVYSAQVDANIDYISLTGQQLESGDELIRQDTTFMKFDLSKLEIDILSEKNKYEYLKKESSRLSLLAKRNLSSDEQSSRAIHELEQSKYRLSLLENRKNVLQEKISRGVLTASKKGVVVSRNVEHGQFAQQGRELLTFVEDDDRSLKCLVEAKLQSHIAQESVAQILLANEEVNGIVNRVSSKLDDVSTSIAIYIEPASKSKSLLILNAYHRVRFPLQYKQLFSIPYKSLVAYKGQNYVYRVSKINGESRVQKVQVDVVDDTELGFVVRGELKQDDIVVTSGKTMLQDKTEVKIIY
ncbi:hypothetical protein N473_01340 [Pseudoalteromonas luteoviolacea CPMOR-1]|uniref:RND efflux pump membrane fusion protein barrel-sandwich domain-containing protein n=1 Tax=Pseudoalteromonas luteoviolacea CPMOR-1 TaxID=1365248 RepID=A0A167LUM4_9GAMM|nr:HlyD family efflux transporter periplasmic adaptor subunit [Pseudoalteromonas luteoviolacea]KZN65246.1 hypothetical protein N473_01340 [Pseudoalteromonas luteoviolacea CPMOR-1]